MSENILEEIKNGDNFDSKVDEEYKVTEWCCHSDNEDDETSQHILLVTQWGDDARKRVPHRQNIKYGKSERCAIDIYSEDLPGDSPIFVFIHGGYWVMGSKNPYGYLSEWLRESGFVLVSVEYDVAPSVTVMEIINEIQQALTLVVKLAQERGCKQIYLGGHSVGAQLSAMLISSKWMDDFNNKSYIKGVILISGLYELSPLLKTNMTKLAKVDRKTVESASPIRYVEQASKYIDPGVKVLITVGEYEPLKFIEQSRNYYHKLLDYQINTSFHLMPGEDHLTIVRNLRKRDYALTREILKLITGNIKDVRN